MDNGNGYWTPVYDTIIQEHGMAAGVVYGRMERYAKMQDGVCKASIETIAENLGIDRKTVIRAQKKLVDAGLIIDVTPGLRNRPHIYNITAVPKEDTEVYQKGTVGVPKRDSTLSQKGTPAIPKRDLNQSIKESIEETLEEEDTGEITPFQVLSDAFTNTTGIQFYDPPRWIDAVNFMLRQNVTPDDIETSFREIKDKYPVHGPWSLQKSALQVKTKRNGNGRGPKIDPRNIPVEEY